MHIANFANGVTGDPSMSTQALVVISPPTKTMPVLRRFRKQRVLSDPVRGSRLNGIRDLVSNFVRMPFRDGLGLKRCFAIFNIT